MAIAYVASSVNSTAANNVSSLTTTTSITKGNFLVAVIRAYVAYTVTDSQGNLWQEVSSMGGTGGFWVTTAKSTGSNVITLATTSGTSNMGLTTAAYSGSNIAVDTSNAGSTAAPTLTGSISVTTRYNNEMVLFGIQNGSGVSGSFDTYTQTSGPTFTARANSVEAGLAEYAQSSAGSVTFGFSVASNNYGIAFALVGLYQRPNGAGLLLGVG